MPLTQELLVARHRSSSGFYTPTPKPGPWGFIIAVLIAAVLGGWLAYALLG